LPTNDTASREQDAAVDVDVLANGFDPTNDPLSVTAFDAASANGGTVDCPVAGICPHTPLRRFTGVDTFDYTMSDGQEPVSVISYTSFARFAVFVAVLANRTSDNTPVVTILDPGNGAVSNPIEYSSGNVGNDVSFHPVSPDGLDRRNDYLAVTTDTGLVEIRDSVAGQLRNRNLRASNVSFARQGAEFLLPREWLFMAGLCRFREAGGGSAWSVHPAKAAARARQQKMAG
jgi:hypothetical protein